MRDGFYDAQGGLERLGGSATIKKEFGLMIAPTNFTGWVQSYSGGEPTRFLSQVG